MKDNKKQPATNSARTQKGKEKSARKDTGYGLAKLEAMIPAMEQRFESAQKRYQTLRKKATPDVSRIEWCKRRRYSPCLCQIERGGDKPGTPLKSEPEPANGMYRYGLSEDGRVLVEEQYRGADGSKEEMFYEYSESEIETTLFDSSKSGKDVIGVSKRLLQNGVAMAFIGYGARGYYVETYEYENGLLARAHRAAPEWNAQTQKDELEPLCTDELERAGGQITRIERRWATGERETLFATKKIDLTLDAAKDFENIYAYAVERVRRFAAKKNKGPGRTGKVKMIELGYEYGQLGWVALVFDTRPDATPDGTWTLHIEPNILKMPHWKEISDGIAERSVTRIQPGGKKEVIRRGSDLAEPLGLLLKSVLLEARADGVFDSLPKADGCEMGVEHFDGGYGWPPFKDRGKENLVSAPPKKGKSKG